MEVRATDTVSFPLRCFNYFSHQKEGLERKISLKYEEIGGSRGNAFSGFG